MATKLGPYTFYSPRKHDDLIVPPDAVAVARGPAFPKLTRESWMRFVHRPGNLDGKYFLIRSADGKAVEAILPSVKTSSLFKKNAQLSFIGQPAAEHLERAISFFKKELRIHFVQYVAGKDEAIVADLLKPLDFVGFSRGLTMTATREAIVRARSKVGGSGNLVLADALTRKDCQKALAIRTTGFQADIVFTQLTPEYYQAALARGEHIVFLKKDEDIVGFCHCTVGGPDMWIEAIVIERKFQGAGYGRHFIQALVNRFPAVKTVGLATSNINEPARHLYESVGFKVVSERIRFIKFL